MQNLREAIAQYRGRVLAEAKERRRAAMMAVCLEYLERWGAAGGLWMFSFGVGRASPACGGAGELRPFPQTPPPPPPPPARNQPTHQPTKSPTNPANQPDQPGPAKLTEPNQANPAKLN